MQLKEGSKFILKNLHFIKDLVITTIVNYLYYSSYHMRINAHYYDFITIIILIAATEIA